MKVELTVKREFEVETLLIDANVRYWEDATVNGVSDEDGDLIPCREGDSWQPIINIDSGLITNWEKGKSASIHYKVCDDGEYWLQDINGNKIAKAKGYYVPDFLAIDDSGLGDYIIMKVDSEGFINNWKFDIDPFEEEEED